MGFSSPLRPNLGWLCLALILGFAALHFFALPAYVFLTRVPDGLAKPHPFVDLHDILLAGTCWRQGVNVYAPSACLEGGVYNYSPLLLRAAWLPLGPQDKLAAGLLFCAAYAASLALLPKPAKGQNFALLAAAAFSPAAYYALEQGNLDTLIFAVLVLALRLRGGRFPIIAAATAAKFYPVALFALALRESRATLVWLAGLGLAGLVLALALDAHAFLAAFRLIPSGTPFRASFGRIDFFRGLAMLGLLPRSAANPASWACAALVLALAGVRRRKWSNALAELDPQNALFLTAGAVVTIFCFMAAQNIEYRALFLVLTLPGLTALGRQFRLLPWLILLLLWESVPRAALLGLTQPYLPTGPGLAFWVLRELLWWGLIMEFLGLTLAFVTRETARLCYGKIDATRQTP